MVSAQATFETQSASSPWRGFTPGTWQSRVNVRFASSSAGPRVLPQAAGRIQCGDRAGWYYDNQSAPTRVVACPSSCQAIKRDPAARVDVLFGCATETLIK